MMHYQETIDYLYNRLPMFSKQGSSAIKKDLVNIKKLCEALGNPHQKFMSIHVAGTNGKGSTSHMLSAVLQSSGYTVGLYTSPHLLDFRERIRIDGKMISQEEVIFFVNENQSLIERIEPSFFEVTVAMAFWYFAKQGVEVAVIETGLGGRLDSTNIINPILSIITNISLDHVSILGNTIPEIAREKAGIIKNKVPVVISEKSEDSATIFKDKAADCESPITFASTQWNLALVEKTEQLLKVKATSISEPIQTETYTLDLTGNYQLKNLAGLLSSITELRRLGFKIPAKKVHIALANIKSLTGLMGRWQTLSEKPLIICDTGHNEKGWIETLINIQQQSYDHLHMVIGVMQDKDIESLLNTFPKNAQYYFCHANFERALNAQDLQNLGHKKGLEGDSYPSISNAIEVAQSVAKPNDLIFIGGSTFVVAEALESFR